MRPLSISLALHAPQQVFRSRPSWTRDTTRAASRSLTKKWRASISKPTARIRSGTTLSPHSVAPYKSKCYFVVYLTVRPFCLPANDDILKLENRNAKSSCTQNPDPTVSPAPSRADIRQIHIAKRPKRSGPQLELPKVN